MPDNKAELYPQVAVVNPLTDEGWNQKVLGCSDCTVFHSQNWARLLAETYGFHPVYLTLSDCGNLVGCLPIMEVNSVFTGRRGVSLSFCDYCGALVRSAEEFKLLFDSALQLGRVSGWRYAEFRGEQYLQQNVPARAYAYHSIPLVDDEVEMQSRLRESTARNIRKAIKEGVNVEISYSRDSVLDYYRLHCLTRKRQGVPPQPILFFEKLHEHLVAKGLGFTVLAQHRGATVAAIICLHFGGQAVYKYGASDLRFQHLRANNLVLWKAIINCAHAGLSSFSLGRTDLDNEGLITFKNGWGGPQTSLEYHRYDFSREDFVAQEDGAPSLYKLLFSKLPLNILRLIGKIAYPHMG